MRNFEKISYEQFKKDIISDKLLYMSYNIPVRKTLNSAGYDFELINSLVIKPNEIIKVPTGIKARMEKDDVLILIVRSSVGFKYNVRLTNQVGIIDADYYNNKDNEGHIWISIQNHSDEEIVFEKGKAICQGIFIKYETTTDEDDIKNKRTGGFGSTNEEEK